MISPPPRVDNACQTPSRAGDDVREYGRVIETDANLSCAVGGGFYPKTRAKSRSFWGFS